MPSMLHAILLMLVIYLVGLGIGWLVFNGGND